MTAIDIVKEFTAAMFSGDVETASKFVADNIVSKTPSETFEGKASWLANAQKARGGLEWYNHQEVTTDGDEVLVVSLAKKKMGLMAVSLRRTIKLSDDMIEEIVVEKM